MKKTLLTFAFGLFISSTFAQSNKLILNSTERQEAAHKTELSDQSSVKYMPQAYDIINNSQHYSSHKSASQLNYRANYTSALFNLFGGSSTFRNSFLTVFPDTSIVQEGFDGINPVYFRPSNHGLVYIYDGTSDIYGTNTGTGTNNYFTPTETVYLDSIFTAGIYFLNNPAATSDRLRFDIITEPWGTGALNILGGNIDVDNDGILDSVAIQTLNISTNTSNGVSAPYTIMGSTPETVFRNFTTDDTSGVVDFGVKIAYSSLATSFQAADGLAILITYEPTPGSYTPNADTVSLVDNTGAVNIFRSLFFNNRVPGDFTSYWLYFSDVNSMFFNYNNSAGFIGPNERYSTTPTNSTVYLYTSHYTSVSVSNDSVPIPPDVSIQEFQRSNGTLHVYPNPNNGNFKLKLENFSHVENYTISVLNILGQEVYTETVKMGNGIKTMSLNNLEKGMYLINLKSKNSNLVKRVTIK